MNKFGAALLVAIGALLMIGGCMTAVIPESEWLAGLLVALIGTVLFGLGFILDLLHSLIKELRRP